MCNKFLAPVEAVRDHCRKVTKISHSNESLPPVTWFVAKDVAEALDYSDQYEMTKRLDDDEKGTAICSTPGGPQEVTIINESGLYHAVLKSYKSEALGYSATYEMTKRLDEDEKLTRQIGGAAQMREMPIEII